MTHHGTETDFEYTTLKRLEALGYRPVFGMELERPHDQVVLTDVLRAWLARRYPDLPLAALDEAVHTISHPEGVDTTLRRNLAFHQLLTRGFDLKVERPDGSSEYRHIYPIDWDDPPANEFWAVNQFPIHGHNDRCPDLGLSDEAMTFYDAIASNFITVYDQELLRSLVHDIVHAVRRNLKVDWTEPYRDDVRAGVRSAVKRILARRGVRQGDLEPLLGSLLV